jgi:hypothetical protein
MRALVRAATQSEAYHLLLPSFFVAIPFFVETHPLSTSLTSHIAPAITQHYAANLVNTNGN